jgi:hypothetical protein
MLAYEPRCMYLTHYGRVGDSVAEVRRLGGLLLQQVDAMVALALAIDHESRDDADRHEAMVRSLRILYRGGLREHGCTLRDERVDELLTMDCELNAQGMAVWLNRRNR